MDVKNIEELNKAVADVLKMSVEDLRPYTLRYNTNSRNVSYTRDSIGKTTTLEIDIGDFIDGIFGEDNSVWINSIYWKYNTRRKHFDVGITCDAMVDNDRSVANINPFDGLCIETMTVMSYKNNALDITATDNVLIEKLKLNTTKPIEVCCGEKVIVGDVENITKNEVVIKSTTLRSRPSVSKPDNVVLEGWLIRIGDVPDNDTGTNAVFLRKCRIDIINSARFRDTRPRFRFVDCDFHVSGWGEVAFQYPVFKCRFHSELSTPEIVLVDAVMTDCEFTGFHTIKTKVNRFVSAKLNTCRFNCKKIDCEDKKPVFFHGCFFSDVDELHNGVLMGGVFDGDFIELHGHVCGEDISMRRSRDINYTYEVSGVVSTAELVEKMKKISNLYKCCRFLGADVNVCDVLESV